MDHPAQVRRCLCRWGQAPHSLQRVGRLHAFLQHIVKVIGQAQRITFIRLEQACLALLYVHEVDRNLEFMQVLHQQGMIVAGDLKERIDLREGDRRLDAVHQGAKARTALFEAQGRATFEPLIPREQGR
jgi:hypothetical protein